MKIPQKIRAFFNDSLWSIAGLMLMNLAAQFCVYPAWSSRLGSEAYGNVIYLMSLLNIWAVSMGGAANYTLVVQHKTSQGCAAFCNWSMAWGSLAAAVYGLVVAVSSKLSGAECLLFAVLAVVTMWRYYADVEYRLSLNFKGYFCYYLAITCGYMLGVGLFMATGLWPIALLPGEIAGCIFVWLRGSLLHQGISRRGADFRTIAKMLTALLCSNLASNLIFNADRLLLRLLLDGATVTTYYLASLLGKTAALITTPLSSVLISYLMLYEGKLSGKFLGILTALSATAIVVGIGMCTFASRILIPVLYPAEYAVCAPYFFIGNLAQVLYFVGNILTVVLLRFAKARNQVYINVVYSAVFLLLCIPGTLYGGFDGFCIALSVTCAIRFLFTLGLCSREVWKNKMSERLSYTHEQ